VTTALRGRMAILPQAVIAHLSGGTVVQTD